MCSSLSRFVRDDMVGRTPLVVVVPGIGCRTAPTKQGPGLHGGGLGLGNACFFIQRVHDLRGGHSNEAFGLPLVVSAFAVADGHNLMAGIQFRPGHAGQLLLLAQHLHEHGLVVSVAIKIVFSLVGIAPQVEQVFLGFDSERHGIAALARDDGRAEPHEPGQHGLTVFQQAIPPQPSHHILQFPLERRCYQLLVVRPPGMIERGAGIAKIAPQVSNAGFVHIRIGLRKAKALLLGGSRA